ncbi:MAG: hypothetical protein CMM96_02635 [Rickettsiales bacterium]|mgnify:FL=1|jgi:prepilin-type N-terminal cleavage/methylation domain-containing protein|nr:hypothetical protein [Rickettsiales bacterium]|tara:strand:+ start:191 stop:883 length:693 start_codon:yes stop_codon:yes gene_type:complete
MLGQEKKANGFSVIELIIVLGLVGVLSAFAYPKFSDWNHSRQVKQDVDRINALIRNTQIQTERGTLAYVKVLFTPVGDKLKVEGKGLTMETLSSLIYDDDSRWFPDDNDLSNRCRGPNGGWDTDTTGDDIIKQSVYDIELENINSNITQASGICFSRNGKFYESYGDLDTGNGTPASFALFCSIKSSADCSDKSREAHLHAIKWSRYGNIYKVRWLPKRGDGEAGWSDPL